MVQPLSQFPHPRVESLHLSLWPLSGSRVKKQAFLKELRTSQLKQSDNPLATLMIPDWTVSGSGVPRSLAIPLLFFGNLPASLTLHSKSHSFVLFGFFVISFIFTC